MTYSLEGRPSRGALPVAGTPAGDQNRDAFYVALLGIIGYDARLIWTPETNETTTSTDRSLNERVITYDATVAARYSPLGSMWQIDFDGTDDEADTPDAAALSFGNSVTDEPFSVGVLCTPDVNNAAMTLIAKENASTAEEWNLRLNASGHLVLTLTDESASGTIVGTFATAVGTAVTLLGAGYDGTGANTGIQLYKNGAKVTTARSAAGSYVAMEDTTALVHLFARYTTKEEFFNGKGALSFITPRYLDDSAWWELKRLVNAYHDVGI